MGIMSEPAELNPTPPDARQRLLEAAEIVFSEKGYDAASVREICALAETNVASISYHFGDKERLYIEAVKNAHSCSFQAKDFPDWPSGTKPVHKLRDFIHVMAEHMLAPVRPTAIRLVMREMSHPSQAAREIVQESISPIAGLLRSVLNELLPHHDERKVLMIGFSVIGQLLYYRQNRYVSEMIFGKEHVDALTTAMVAEHVTQFTLAALGLADPVLPRSAQGGGA